MTIDRRSRARGFIDNRPTFWIILILVVVGGWQYLEMTGALPDGLWDRVPGIWKALLAAAGMLIVVGAIALFIAGRMEERREPYRVENGGGRRLVHEIAVLERTLGAVLLAAGMVLLGFGSAGAGWFSWIVLVSGALLALLSLGPLSGGRRFIVERGRLVSESCMLWNWSQAGAHSWEPGRAPQLEVRKAEFGGGFGRSWFEPAAVLVDGQKLPGSTRDANKLLPLLQQAIAETSA